jgi:hypothetical protein
MMNDGVQRPFLLHFGERLSASVPSADRKSVSGAREPIRGQEGTRKTAVGRETTDED